MPNLNTSNRPAQKVTNIGQYIAAKTALENVLVRETKNGTTVFHNGAFIPEKDFFSTAIQPSSFLRPFNYKGENQDKQTV